MKPCLFSHCNWLWALKSRGASAVDVVCDTGQVSGRAQSSPGLWPVSDAVAVLETRVSYPALSPT